MPTDRQAKGSTNRVSPKISTVFFSTKKQKNKKTTKKAKKQGLKQRKKKAEKKGKNKQK